jgi:DNA primase
MAFTPGFLDELRSRVSLAEMVGRRVRLQKRGREFTGLCPFHKEKTPSFHVVEDKGFYHCFGCGAHGDVIGFAMQTQNLGFREAVEELARAAGLQVPRDTPAEREREERRATLQQALAAAAAFFEAALAGPHGQTARAYLQQRGLDGDTIRRFHLGYAPDSRDSLKRTLAKDFPEALLIEAGLLHRRDDGSDAFDYFRNRVMFPIGDRRGQTIAFGGRVLGDGQPKYLNSPESPLFQKGRVLYGWAAARAAAAREPSVIVTEGYMDVIALHRAGFGTAVAPLGTALGELQIEDLWKLAPEPILCFDGDAAGQRAAARALDRALPLLKPGLSLRFATLPEGEDPDTLLQRQGQEAMREVLARARPLAEILWEFETSKPCDTPERRAALESRLDARTRKIADRGVQEHYRAFFRERLFQAFRGRRNFGKKSSRPGSWRKNAALPEAPPTADPRLLRRRQQEVLVALLINHPFLLGEMEEELVELHLPARDLDKLCHEILRIHACKQDLDATALKLQLSENGFGGLVRELLSPRVMRHAGFARPEADAGLARCGWNDTRDRFFERKLDSEIADGERGLAEDMSDEKWARWRPLLKRKGETEDEFGGGFSGRE